MGLGSAVSSPTGFGAEPRLPKGFPLFSTLRMVSPGTIILLIVDYHAANGEKTLYPALAHARVVSTVFSHPRSEG